MKVHELIELLKQEDADAHVHFAYNYGDRSQTQVAPLVRRVTNERVAHSDYHSLPAVLDEDDRGFEDAIEVVVLK